MARRSTESKMTDEDIEFLSDNRHRALVFCASGELKRRQDRGESLSDFDLWLVLDRWQVWRG